VARRTPPRLLTLAGSDSGGGAGIQADLKTFAAHGTYGMSVITALTAQNTREVRAVHEVPPEMVAAQIAAVFDDIGVDAVKIGMLASAPIIRAVAEQLRRCCTPGLPIVLDPVMIAKSGAALLRDDAVEALMAELLPLCTLVTPNAPELERLTGLPVTSEEQQLQAAETLGKSAGGPAVLAKGGHMPGSEVVDLLLGEENCWRFAHSRVETRSTHGTGCTLSAAIAARLGWGDGLPQAVSGGIAYLQGAMAAAYPLGSGAGGAGEERGHGPVDHFYNLDLRRS
jgi:hydroxymethylpyrimidine/phosphomethylpyrimidine kinase